MTELIGHPVRYYRNGWRIGHLEEIDKNQARIRPLAAYGKEKRCHWIPLSDVEPCDKENAETDKLNRQEIREPAGNRKIARKR